ncbi:MAG: cobalamin-independent methionine synthase II family protein [Proteobacteria bacterium]|nr:cobalamin-independent methionine synthase II family protein [Pseudomonadota bacterium]
MSIPTEPIGSVPRPQSLIDALTSGSDPAELAAQMQAATEDTIARFEATGSPIITDGEQSKPSFATYSIHGLQNLAPDGVVIPFADGHSRQLPRLTEGPFRYATYAGKYTAAAKELTRTPIKQAVISASALSLLYPQDGLVDYPQERFLDDLVEEAERDIRRCFEAGAERVQIDFTEGRLSLKLDPSGGLLRQFVALNNRVLSRFSNEERAKIGIHTCPGGDHDSTHSADVPYTELLPDLFETKVGSFYVQLASESDPEPTLALLGKLVKGNQRVFVGVIDPISPEVESAEQVKARILRAVRHIPVSNLGTTDDCGFAPFADDTATARDISFAKIRARVEGTRLAEVELG